MKKIAIGLVTLAIAAASLTSCAIGNKAQQPYKDAPRSGNDSGAALTVEMPDGFSNVATKCIQGTDIRVTVLYHGNSHYGSVSTVVDPGCRN